MAKDGGMAEALRQQTAAPDPRLDLLVEVADLLATAVAENNRVRGEMQHFALQQARRKLTDLRRVGKQRAA